MHNFRIYDIYIYDINPKGNKCWGSYQGQFPEMLCGHEKANRWFGGKLSAKEKIICFPKPP